MFTPNRYVFTYVPNFLEQKYTHEIHLFNIYHAWGRGREMRTSLLSDNLMGIAVDWKIILK